MVGRGSKHEAQGQTLHGKCPFGLSVWTVRTVQCAAVRTVQCAALRTTCLCLTPLYSLSSFFQFIERLRKVRDDEEGFGDYHPHPLMVPMADTSSFAAEVSLYDYAAHDVWGVQVYRGSTFGNLFQNYVSTKPLLVSEYGMDAYSDIQTSTATSSLHVDDRSTPSTR